MKEKIVKIPKVITVVYSNKKKTLVICQFLIKKILKLNFQLILVKQQWILKLSNITFNYRRKNFKKQLKSLWNTTISLIKRMLIETNVLLYKQLKLVGIGYWVFNITNLKRKILLFKLGYSHFLYFGTTLNVNLVSIKTTELFIYGCFYETITKIAALIKQFKKPESYKNKGISYKNETFPLKIIKKLQ